MKKYLSLILALCLPALLGGCGAVPLPMPESPTPPPAADTEEITYEVSTDPYEQTVTAEDGTTLMVIDFQIPHLQAYANGALIEDPSTPAQEQAMDRVHTFNENFDQWRESNSSEENISFVKDLYRDMPEMFSEDHMAPLSEELTYTATAPAPSSALPPIITAIWAVRTPTPCISHGTMIWTAACSSPSRSWLPIPRPSRWQ